MAGTDAAKQSKVLEAAFQMALKLPYPELSQPDQTSPCPRCVSDKFQREHYFLGKGITVKAQFTSFPAECQCLSGESVRLVMKRRIEYRGRLPR